jgi:glycerol-3-phosphate acyltransferase PlsX
MGSVYSREILGYKKPRVGILSNGTEEGKGTELTQEALQLCKQIDVNFVGYVEGYDLFSNTVDVVICDGFTGNIVLKTCESLALGIVGMLKRELTRNPKRMLGAFLAQNALRALKRRMDPEVYGGAPLLGLNGTVMKSHGSAKQKSIVSALRITTDSLQHQINQTIINEIQRANERLATNQKDVPSNVPA